MNSPGPLPPVDPDARQHLVTVGGFAYTFFTIGWGEIVTDAHDGAPDTWLVPVALGVLFGVLAARMRQSRLA